MIIPFGAVLGLTNHTPECAVHGRLALGKHPSADNRLITGVPGFPAGPTDRSLGS